MSKRKRRDPTGDRSVSGKGGDIFVVPPGTLHALYKTKGSSIEYENIIFEVDFLGAGAADLCAGEFLVPLAAGKLLPPICVQEQEEGYDVLKQCLSQMEDLCASREKGYELGVKAAVLQLLFLLIRKHPSVKEVSSPDREQLKMVLHKIEKISMKILQLERWQSSADGVTAILCAGSKDDGIKSDRLCE